MINDKRSFGRVKYTFGLRERFRVAKSQVIVCVRASCAYTTAPRRTFGGKNHFSLDGHKLFTVRGSGSMDAERCKIPSTGFKRTRQFTVNDG